jgi:glycosyltransferase involved in cell wall biosynthesis
MFSTDYFPPRKMNANHNRLFYLAKGLNNNHNVIIFCPNNKYRYDEALFQGIRIIRFPSIKLKIINKVFNVLSAHRFIKKILVKYNIKPDILWYNSPQSFVLSKHFDCVKIYDIMGIVSNELLTEESIYNIIKSWIYKKLEKITYKNSSFIITINDLHKKLLSKYFKKKIYVLRDAVEHNSEINKKLYAQLKKRHENKFILFFVGSFGRKRFEKNRSAFVSLIKKYPNIRIIIAGEGKYLSYYKKIFFELINNTEFIGHVKGAELNSYIKSSDICFSDVYLEGFPYKIFEYMALGKVSLVEETASVKEILIDKKNSLLYKNSEEFEKKVSLVINNSSLRKSIEKNALIESKNNTWNHREEEFRKIILEVTR